MRLSVHQLENMVNIDSDEIAYASMAGITKTGQHMTGIQINPHLRRKYALRMCDQIADAVYGFHGMPVPIKLICIKDHESGCMAGHSYTGFIRRASLEEEVVSIQMNDEDESPVQVPIHDAALHFARDLSYLIPPS